MLLLRIARRSGNQQLQPAARGHELVFYDQPYQNVFSDNAWYPTYDVIPGPAAAANGYAVPYVATLLLNYKHHRFTTTNSWNFVSGAEYGAPTAWPG